MEKLFSVAAGITDIFREEKIWSSKKKKMPAICWECGQHGHLRARCPQVSCRQCGRRGHLERVCAAASASMRQPDNYRRKDKPTSNDTRSSNPHRLPWNWTLCARYRGSFGDAIAGLGKEGRKYAMEEVREEEFQAIEDLVQRTWDGRRVGIGVDGANLHHSAIKVVKIERIENPGTYEQYSRVKQTMLQIPRSERDSVYPPVENIHEGSRPIWTRSAIKHDSFLWGNFFPRINEYYLFHGTKEGNVVSIAEQGFNMDYSLDRGLMGAGIYFAESSTKADMYADLRHNRKTGDKHMFLVRVLMGRMYVNTLKTKLNFQHPPCCHCLQHDCGCDYPEYFDSVIDDSRRLFRVFAVYSSDQCYPEYLITYRRVHDDNDDDDDYEDEDYSEDEYRYCYSQDVEEGDDRNDLQKEPPVTTQVAEAARVKPHYPPSIILRPPSPNVSHDPRPIVIRPPSPIVRHEPRPSPVTPYQGYEEAYIPGFVWYPGSGLERRRSDVVNKEDDAGCCCCCFSCLPCRKLPPDDCCVDIPDDDFRTAGQSGIVCCLSEACKVLAIIMCSLLLLGGTANPIAMFSYGRLHVGDCPGSSEMTTYLQALGLCAFLWHLFSCALMFDRTLLPTSCGFGLSVALVFIASLGLQIFGFVIVYPYKGEFNATHPSSDNYCSEEVYTFAFVTTTLQTILLVLCPVSGCLLRALNKTVLKVVTGFFLGLGVVVVGAIFLCAVSLPIALVVVGALKLDNCPWLPFLPMVALGAGAALLLCFLGLVISACCCHLDKTKGRLNVWRTVVVFYFLMLVTLQVLGYLYLYPYKAQTFSLDPSSAMYCDSTLYQLTYTTSTFVCLLYLVVPGLLWATQV